MDSDFFPILIGKSRQRFRDGLQVKKMAYQSRGAERGFRQFTLRTTFLALGTFLEIERDDERCGERYQKNTRLAKKKTRSNLPDNNRQNVKIYPNLWNRVKFLSENRQNSYGTRKRVVDVVRRELDTRTEIRKTVNTRLHPLQRKRVVTEKRGSHAEKRIPAAAAVAATKRESRAGVQEGGGVHSGSFGSRVAPKPPPPLST